MKLRILAVLVVLAAASTGFAQSNNGGNNGRGNRGNRGNGQQGRQQFDQRLKDQLGVSDDEWNVLQPRIDKVRQLERDARSRGARNGRNGRGNRNRDSNQNADATANSDRPTSEVQQKAQTLQKLLDGKDSNPDAIKAAVTDLREAKVKARADLKKAQDDLRDLLTARQESVLVMAGILE